jgi:hypothetical protein
VQAIEVDRFPISAVDAKCQPLLGPSGLDHDGAAVPAKVNDPFPQLIPDSARDRADEDPRSDLEQPPRDVPAQARGHGRQHEHYHGSSP